MFKYNGFEQELQKSMEKTLVANQVEDIHKFKKIAQAVDYLNNAAYLLNNDKEISEDLNKVLSNIVNKIG